ncbi:MAG: ceramidase domain-containing protein [Myxococcota bacterium]|nr:ceramidase domain-containing protein [Myxococcota bacterium]
MIDLYCERTEPGLWAEPLNTLTNLSFFIAAFAAWRWASRQGKPDRSVVALTVLIVAIGIGSSLFHTFASRWAEMADVIPIGMFEVCYLWLYLRRITGLRRRWCIGVMIVFAIGIYLAGQFPDLLNGSVMYAPGFVLLVALGIVHICQKKKSPYLLLGSAAVFLVALTARSTDMLVCDVLPIGLHFVWHLLNGLLIYLLMRAYIANV